MASEKKFELSYLANEFCMKNQYFCELPDTIVKCYADKFFAKKKSNYPEHYIWWLGMGD